MSFKKGDEFDICEGGDGVKEGHAGMAEVFVTIGLRKVYSCTWGSSKRCFVISILCHRPSNDLKLEQGVTSYERAIYDSTQCTYLARIALKSTRCKNIYRPIPEEGKWKQDTRTSCHAPKR